MSNGDNGVNRRQVRLDLKDVYGDTIHDTVRITFRNQRAFSLSQEFMVEFLGSPVAPPEPVPAFPFGGAELEIQPTIYRFKNLLVQAPAGSGPGSGAGGERSLRPSWWPAHDPKGRWQGFGRLRSWCAFLARQRRPFSPGPRRM
jgi:hypothetical protein